MKDPFATFYDGSDVPEQGTGDFPLIDPGEYQARLTSWSAYQKEENKIVHWIDFQIVGGKFDEKSKRYFHTIKTDDKDSRDFFVRLLRDLGLIKDPEDRLEDNSLPFRVVYGPPQNNGHQDVLAVEVKNNDGEPVQRNTLNRMATIVIEHEEDKREKSPNYGKMQDWIKYVNPPADPDSVEQAADTVDEVPF